MNLFSQLVVGTITAIAATFAAHQCQLSAPLQLGALIVAATWISPILNKIMLARSRAASARPTSTAKPKSQPRSKSEIASPSPAKKHSGAAREEGEVKWFDVSKGFGFIRRDNDQEIFVHHRSITGTNGSHRGLKNGQRVSYVIAENHKGLQAEEVEAL